VLEPVEARIMGSASFLLLVVAIILVVFPRLVTYPLIVLSLWIAVALAYRAYELRKHQPKKLESETAKQLEGE
jgi:hypothetical protein